MRWKLWCRKCELKTVLYKLWGKNCGIKTTFQNIRTRNQPLRQFCSPQFCRHLYLFITPHRSSIHADWSLINSHFGTSISLASDTRPVWLLDYQNLVPRKRCSISRTLASGRQTRRLATKLRDDARTCTILLVKPGVYLWNSRRFRIEWLWWYDFALSEFQALSLAACNCHYIEWSNVRDMWCGVQTNDCCLSFRTWHDPRVD